MMSYTIKSTQPESLNTILTNLKAWRANVGLLTTLEEELYDEAYERLEFLREKFNQRPYIPAR